MISETASPALKTIYKGKDALDEYRAEVGAFANQRLLGNKAFVKKLITTEPSTAEKLIAKIRELREDLKVRKDPEAKAQLEFVRKAEKLFMQGLSEAGGTINATGKIHLANREEDETVSKGGETVIETTENVSESSKSVRRLANPKNVDKGDGKRYNMNRTTVDEKAGTDYLIHNFNGEVRYDPEILPLSDRELAVISHAVKTGWGKLNVDKKYGYVFSSKNCYAFFYNSDNSITITSYFDADIHQELINIAKEVVENDTNGEGKVEDSGIWASFLRNGGAGYRYHVDGSLQEARTRGSTDPMAGHARGSHDGGDLGRSGGDRANGQVKFRRKGERATLTVNGETLNSIGEPTYRSDVMQRRRVVWRFGVNRYYVEGASSGTALFHDTVEAAIEAENESLISRYAKQHGTTTDFVKRRLDEDPEYLYKALEEGVRRSRNVTGETVTISKGEMAKLHANYAGDKVFAKGAVTEALKGIDALKALSAERRREIANEIWTGYNKRLHQQGFELFTELAWHQIHAEVMQETSFEMDEDAVRVMDEQIVNALNTIVQSGKPSIKAKLESDTSTEGYRKQADFWRGEHSKAVQRNKQLNSLKFELEKLANQKKGLYVNAANFRGDSFKVAIDELAKMNWRGGLVSDTKIREHFAKLAAWYTKENPLYKGDGGTGSLFRQEIADTLNSLGNSQNGALTVEDLQAAETVVKYFAHEIEAHNTVFKDGKRVDAMPEAKDYIEKVRQAKEIAAKCGIWSNLMRSKFARMVADPAMLMRQADGYLSGFFTEQYEALRQGTIDAAVLERELSEEFEQFWEKNKAYAKRYNDATVKFGDTEMPLQEAISLYMTMKREHAFAGLAGAGFDIEGKKATEEISAGFAEEVNRQLAEDWKALPPEELLTLTKKKNAEMERAALARVIEKKREALYDQFTAEDRALIELMERAFEQCRDVKVKIDEIVQGYSNVTGGYYYPIKRTGLAENVDAYTGFEGDRVTNLSMNKDTVKNAHKLLIEPAHIVFMRHLKATSLYHGLGVFTDNFNRLYNLNIGSNANNPITVRTALGQSNNFSKEMIKYFKELKQDVEGISKKRSQEKWYNDAVGFIRSSYATYQLGANPKVWVTQLSSLVAATNILDADCIAKGLRVSGKDVDEHCRLAWLRNNDSSAVQAQAVGTSQNAVQRAGRNALQKVRDVAMLPIGKVDRLVITRLFGACQVQVEKKGGAKVGTKENKIEAGKLLQRVILETQQNSLATERSAAMRSSDELLKGFTMFSADAMKVGARFVDAFGELSVLRTRLREVKKAGDSKAAARLEGEIKRVRTQCVRSTVALVGVALFNAALAYAFKWLYRRDEEENLGTFIADTFGNMLGGIPFVRDLWSFFQDGFEMDHFLISTVNDVLGTAAASFELVSDAASGKEVTRQEALANMRKVLYAAGQLSGVPVRNVYNVTTGLLNRVAPEAGYTVESQFKKRAYASDLKKAIEAGDDGMVGTIAGLMIDEKVGITDGATRDALRRLTEKGHAVLRRSVGDSVTVNGETVTLTGAQQKKLREVYGIGQDAVVDMVKLQQFRSAGDEVQAKAIKFIYDVYWDLALEDALGLDLAEKNVLFSEAIDIEKLAIIIATARSIEADKDKDGKAIAGTKKRKLQTFVNSLRLSAAEKYMVMGYLGYTNVNGESAVKAHISKLNLSKSEKEKLLGYSGYGA